MLLFEDRKAFWNNLERMSRKSAYKNSIKDDSVIILIIQHSDTRMNLFSSQYRVIFFFIILDFFYYIYFIVLNLLFFMNNCLLCKFCLTLE